MRKIALLLAILLLLAGCAPPEASPPEAPEAELPAQTPEEEIPPEADPPGEEEEPPAPERTYLDFFAEEKVHELYIEIDEADWQAILAAPAAMQYYPVTAALDDVIIEDVGFRTRGHSSLRVAIMTEDSARYPFRLKFDKYVDDQRFLGLDELVLTNSVDDPSFVREYLGYEAFRQLGMTVPVVTFFDLYINGQLQGLYVGVEAIDNRFLNRAFGGHKGTLYEAGSQSTLTPGMNLGLMELKKGKDETRADVARLIQVLQSMPTGQKGEIESILDVDSVLRYMAANAVIHNWDDYAGIFAHNYYFYVEGGIFHIIPWDMNEGFLQTGPHFQPSDGSRQEIATPIPGELTPEERPMAAKLLAVPEYYRQYLDHCETLRRWLLTLPDELPALMDRLAPSVERDPTKYYGYQGFLQQFNSGWRGGLAGFIVDRADYLGRRLPELMKDPVFPGASQTGEDGL